MPYADPKDPRKLQRVNAWSAANPEKVKAAKKKYAEANKEAVQARIAAWREANKEKMSQARRAWRVKNKDRDLANTRNRQLGKIKRTPCWLTEDDYWMIEQAYELAKIRTQVFGFSWNVDHIVPLHGKTVSGLHVPNNLQVIPGTENSRKNNKYELHDSF
jgi:hypothetical protein